MAGERRDGVAGWGRNLMRDYLCIAATPPSSPDDLGTKSLRLVMIIPVL
jgi:hypothetical protein